MQRFAFVDLVASNLARGNVRFWVNRCDGLMSDLGWEADIWVNDRFSPSNRVHSRSRPIIACLRPQIEANPKT